MVKKDAEQRNEGLHDDNDNVILEINNNNKKNASTASSSTEMNHVEARRNSDHSVIGTRRKQRIHRLNESSSIASNASSSTTIDKRHSEVEETNDHSRISKKKNSRKKSIANRSKPHPSSVTNIKQKKRGRPHVGDMSSSPSSSGTDQSEKSFQRLQKRRQERHVRNRERGNNVESQREDKGSRRLKKRQQERHLRNRERISHLSSNRTTENRHSQPGAHYGSADDYDVYSETDSDFDTVESEQGDDNNNRNTNDEVHPNFFGDGSIAVALEAVTRNDLEDQLRRQLMAETVRADAISTTDHDHPNNVEQEEKKKRRRRKWLCLSISGCCCTLVLIIIVVVVLVLQDDNTSSTTLNGNEQDDRRGDNNSTKQFNLTDDQNAILDYIKSVSPDRGQAITLGNTPQFFAFQWLLSDPYVTTEIDKSRRKKRRLGQQQDHRQMITSNIMENQTLVSTWLERYVMATLFYSTNPSPVRNGQLAKISWTNSQGWLSGNHICTWYSKSISHPVCSRDRQHIMTLNLNNNNLEGTLPDELVLLKYLRSIKLPDNEIGGFLPGAWGLHSTNGWDGTTSDEEESSENEMRVIDLHNNNLEGTIIPTEWQSFQKLEIIDLRTNLLSGEIPFDSVISGLPNLAVLELGNNKLLLGSIPSSIGQLTNLVALTLENSALSGSLPAELGMLKKLQRLIISHDTRLNEFSPPSLMTGTIPYEIWSLSNLMHLDLSNLQLKGHIISSTTMNQFAATSLRYLNLGYNSLSGTVPFDLLSVTNLVFFDISNNDSIFGSRFITDTFFNTMINLQVLNVANNPGLGGSISSNIGKLSNLERFDISSCAFTRTIPTEIGLVTNLKVLDVHSNVLSGIIPSEIGNIRNSTGTLEILDVSQNFALRGNIPPRIGNLTSLSILNLQQNNFNGPIAIPIEFSSLRKLKRFSIANNEFDIQPIPAKTLSNMFALQELDISHNSFSGPLPIELSYLNNLVSLNLDNNFLTGTIPQSMASYQNIQSYHFEGNSFSGNIPEEFCSKTDPHQSEAQIDLYADCTEESGGIECHCCSHCCYIGNTSTGTTTCNLNVEWSMNPKGDDDSNIFGDDGFGGGGR